MNRPVRRVTLTAVSLCVAAFAVAAVAAQPAFGDPPPITGLVSTSHPLAGSWYANPDPVFSWRGVGAASSVTGYSFGLDQDTATIPDTTIDLPPLSFAPRRDISVAVYPTDVAVGDFNRDRKLDLAVLNGNAGSVTIFLGRGNGMFVPRPTFRVGTYSGPIAVGDLNRDGHPDLVVGRQGRAIVLLGHGDGSFAGPHSYSVGTRSDALVIADVNGDRRPDIVSSSGDQVRVLLGRGDGSFGAPRGSVADANGRVGPLAVGDLNGDRRPDVVAGSQEGANLPVGALSVLLGRGTGSFRAAVTHTTDTLLPTGLVVADVNHDGRPDLLVGDYADGVDYGTPSFGAVLVFLGKGDGTFSPGARYDVGQGQLTPKLKLADFNHDGNVDLLVATTAGLSVLLGNGDGAFQAPMQFDSTHRVGGPAVAVGDFNRDGKPDVAVISPESKTVGVFLNRSNGVAYHGIADGVWYFHMRAVDADSVGGPTATRVVRIDTQPPSTRAPNVATVRSGAVASLTYEVSDPPPSAGWCTVLVEVKNGRGTVLFHHAAGHVHSGVLYQTGFRCDLARGTYRFYVYATDAAGNTQGNVAWSRLIVK